MKLPDDPITFLKSLRTVRFFEHKPVSQEAMNDILEGRADVHQAFLELGRALICWNHVQRSY